MPEILVLYYSRGGSVARLARQIARGVGEVEGMSARLRSVPPVAAVTQQAAPPVPEDGAPYVDRQDLAECAGLVLGSPTRFGNMAAPVKHFIDGLGAEWASGTSANKVVYASEPAAWNNRSSRKRLARKRKNVPARARSRMRSLQRFNESSGSMGGRVTDAPWGRHRRY